MLHEVFLALSGHPSPLFESKGSQDFPLVTPAETALLESIGHLAHLHRLLRERLASLSRQHGSVICRSVATSVRTTHLARFQQAVLDVERNILLRDPSSVGAYDLVPLSTIAAQFEPWKRRLEWYWELTEFMSPRTAAAQNQKSASKTCSGVDMLNKLHRDLQTGFRDLESAAIELTAVAERTWIRLLIQWISTGTVATQHGRDFFVTGNASEGLSEHGIDKLCLPGFVTEQIANSILFLGSTLRMLRSSGSLPAHEDQRTSSDEDSSPPSLTSATYLKALASLPSPLTASRLSRVISEMRSSLAQEVVAKVLPVHKFMHVLAMLRQFFLAGRGDFTDALIHEADDYLSSRHRQLQTGKAFDAAKGLAGVMMKEGEMKAVLSRTFTALAPFINKGTLVDDDLEWAKEHISLGTASPEPKTLNGLNELDVRFKALLLLTPVEMSLRLDQTFDIFFDASDRNAYSAMNTYLTSIRRGHNHLSNLWRLSQLRRDTPAPTKPRRMKSVAAFEALKQRRRSYISRMHAMKMAWTNASAVVCLLAELGRYLSDEVVDGSWTGFRRWALQAGDEKKTDAEVEGATAAGSAKEVPRDPQVLAQGHRQYLTAMTDMLLLTNEPYTKALRTLLQQIDFFVPLMHRLQDAQRNADQQEEGVLEENSRNYAAELFFTGTEINRASQSLKRAMDALIDALRRASEQLRNQTKTTNPDTGFQPLMTVSGIDRLLIRLDFRTEQDDN